MTADSENDIRALKAIAAQFEHTVIVTKNQPIILTL